MALYIGDVRLPKNSNRQSYGLISFAIVCWIIFVQLSFNAVQSFQASISVKSLQSQFRQELEYSNFHYLSRSLSDLTAAESVQCVRLKKVWPNHLKILDLRYQSNFCESPEWRLNGAERAVELKSLNEDHYRVEFRTKNQPAFYIAVWVSRLMGILFIALASFSLRLLAERSRAATLRNTEVAEAKFQLARSIAHDIRSPLSVVSLIAGRLKDRLPEEGSLLWQASTQIVQIAEGLLSNSFSGHLEVPDRLPQQRSKDVLAAGVPAATIGEDCTKLIIQKQIEFQNLTRISIRNYIHLHGEIEFRCDTIQLCRVLSNLINNAMEAIPDAGFVTITAGIEADSLRIEVRDSGVGMPMETLDRLGKQQFTSGKQRGHGIGVFSSVQVIQSWGGEIRFYSKPGVGTTVSISLVRA